MSLNPEWTPESEKSNNISSPSNNLSASTAVVSDANTEDSRQVLHAHVYNYLIKNGHYATARQFLLEADVPLSNKNSGEVTMCDISNDGNIDIYGQQLPPDLLSTRLQEDSEDTLLFEWWNAFSKLRDHVEQTPLEELRPGQSDAPKPFLPEDTSPSTKKDQVSIQ